MPTTLQHRPVRRSLGEGGASSIQQLASHLWYAFCLTLCLSAAVMNFPAAIVQSPRGAANTIPAFVTLPALSLSNGAVPSITYNLSGSSTELYQVQHSIDCLSWTPLSNTLGGSSFTVFKTNPAEYFRAQKIAEWSATLKTWNFGTTAPGPRGALVQSTTWQTITNGYARTNCGYYTLPLIIAINGTNTLIATLTALPAALSAAVPLTNTWTSQTRPKITAQ